MTEFTIVLSRMRTRPARMLARYSVHYANLHDYLPNRLPTRYKKHDLNDEYDEGCQQRENNHYRKRPKKEPGIEVCKVGNPDTGYRNSDYHGSNCDHKVDQKVNNPCSQAHLWACQLGRRLLSRHPT